MAEETRVFENAQIKVGDQTSDPMTVTIEVTRTPEGKRSGAGEAKLSEEVFAAIESVNGAAHVHTQNGDTFAIMMRKAYKQSFRVEFVTSGPVPEPS
ncbi:hypothetical protein [uncultured Sulfitobacter sp.]|uniref:hypothetical protein n=1 Tax=uncultured Sulfitobacter sp. TaxID=191468 RepID=UPI0026265B14|nr:hypothetical protein [uncultured Sulfitobacter sp.]